jgi:hypothetical protein
MKWPGRLLLAGFFASLLAAGTAYAQAVSSDPNPGSPPRAVYELPLDIARKDAAPRPKGSGKESDSSSSGFRSENNFGSSAIVPGDPRGGGGGGDGAGAGAAGSGVAGDDSGLAPTAASLDTGDPSESRALLLLGLILVVGVLLGLPSARSRTSDS